MFKKAITLVGSAILAGALVCGPVAANAAAPASAVAASVSVAAKKTVKNSVSVKTIGTKSVAPAKKTTIKPVLVKRGTVKILTSSLTVEKGKKVVAKNKKSVALGAGQYKVKTKVSYRLKTGNKWSPAKTASKTQSLLIKTVKQAAKINTAAGRADVLKLINADRKANGLGPVKLLKTMPYGPVYRAATDFSGFYDYTGKRWPTAKEWYSWYDFRDPMKRLLKDKKAFGVTVDAWVATTLPAGRKFNVLDIRVYGAPDPEVKVDLDKPNAKDRLVKALQDERRAMKLPPFIMGSGEPVLRPGEYFSATSTRGVTGKHTVEEVATNRDFLELARDKYYTHASIDIVKDEYGYTVGYGAYQLSGD